jgi:Transposase domain (DUF772)
MMRPGGEASDQVAASAAQFMDRDFKKTWTVCGNHGCEKRIEYLEDEQLLDTVYEAQGERHPQSRVRGREQTPSEVVVRLLLLKHVRNWSYETLEREVRANLVYRSFCRIGMEKVLDAKTLGRIGQSLGPEVISELHRRLVQLAQEKAWSRTENARGRRGENPAGDIRASPEARGCRCRLLFTGQ